MYNLLIEYLIRAILSEEGFTSLNVRSFRGSSHKDRTDKFVDYMKSGKPLPLKKGEASVVVKSVEIVKDGKSTTYDPSTQSEELEDILPQLQSGDKLFLYDKAGKKYSITAVAKTADLGGRGVGNVAGAAIESAEVASLQKAIDAANTTGEGITIEAAGISYPNIVKVEKVPGMKKADFQLVNKEGKAVVFIQHKSPKHQQMSGIARGAIKNYAEVQEFVQRIRKAVAVKGKLDKKHWKVVKDPELRQLAAYGTVDGTFGPDAVQLYCVGPLGLKSSGEGSFKISATHIYEYPTPPSGKDVPVLAATYRSGRNQSGIQDTRLGIYPADYVGGLDF